MTRAHLRATRLEWAVASRVTVETKVWEADWQRLIRGRQVDRIFDLNACDAKTRLLINNVASPQIVSEEAQRLVHEGVLGEVTVVREHLDDALLHYDLDAAQLGAGLPYSSAELVGVLTCHTEFLCHFAGDCVMGHVSDWIVRGIELLESNPQIAVVNPLWNGEYQQAVNESTEMVGPYCIGFGFSDQCYLVRTEDFRNANLTRLHVESERYPAYGGNLFEKRVDSWMRYENRLRATDTRATYLHLG